MYPYRSGRVTPSRSKVLGTPSQKSLDAPYTAGRRTRWTLSMDRLFLRESHSKKRCKAIDAVAKPTCSHHPLPDSRARPKEAAHCAGAKRNGDQRGGFIREEIGAAGPEQSHRACIELYYQQTGNLFHNSADIPFHHGRFSRRAL